jgi:hypothetical protein
LEATIREWLKLAIARPDNRPLCFKGYKEKRKKKERNNYIEPHVCYKQKLGKF